MITTTTGEGSLVTDVDLESAVASDSVQTNEIDTTNPAYYAHKRKELLGTRHQIIHAVPELRVPMLLRSPLAEGRFV